MRFRVPALAIALVIWMSSRANAQDTVATRLAPVVVEVGRGTHGSPLDLPFAVSVQTPDSSRPGQRHLSLDETLSLIPGLSVSNRNNPSQDPRISIRGFGARSAFGVRGIRVLRDGLPLTLPDGQTPVDYLDLESVGRVEVMRGSASSLYGNAGGGVVDLRTSDPLPVPVSGEARLWTGSFGTRRIVGKTGGAANGFSYQGNVARTESDGYREYSRQRTTNGFARLSLDAGGGSYALDWLGLNTPLAQNPGSLTRAQFDADPRMADPLSIRKAARKEVTQSQLGLTGRRGFTRGEVEASAYAGTRSLFNPLTFGIVDVGRAISGGNVRGTVPLTLLGTNHRLTAGVELQLQNDLRLNYTNCNNIPPPTVPTATCPDPASERGSVTLNQREIISSIGSYLRDEMDLGERYTLTGAARADAVRFEVKDRLIDAINPDDSGRRPLHAISPMVGFLARLSPLQSAYANISTAFETPTATELGNQPSGAAGINRELKPQRSLTYEVGLKGVRTSGWQYNAALFATRVQDELIPYDIPASGGRRYFRNAGRTSRRGVELGTGVTAGAFDLGGAYTYANYRFVDFTVDTAHYAGHRIPGIPRQTFQASASARSVVGILVTEATVADRMFVNDANSESSPGYAIFNARFVSVASMGLSGAEITLGAQNIFNRKYVSSVNVNAAGGKFYEPGSQRSIYVGVSLLAAARPLK
ncbi:MAG: iron complex outerrane recepter protein [Gemmatimonadaceae bacterium]|nr:iron complex outerrane recepter protein [Gemmatimonadaceae bacterium]